MPASIAHDEVNSLKPLAGISPVELRPDDVEGIWTLSFGRFGWKEYEARGAIIRIENGSIFGGGSNFVYRGRCELHDGGLKIRMTVDRYRSDPAFASITGLQGDHFEIDCIVDAITRDHLEGRTRNQDSSSRDVLPEIRLALVRFGAL